LDLAVVSSTPLIPICYALVTGQPKPAKHILIISTDAPVVAGADYIGRYSCNSIQPLKIFTQRSAWYDTIKEQLYEKVSEDEEQNTRTVVV
jgi:hypothetical protein